MLHLSFGTLCVVCTGCVLAPPSSYGVGKTQLIVTLSCMNPVSCGFLRLHCHRKSAEGCTIFVGMKVHQALKNGESGMGERSLTFVAWQRRWEPGHECQAGARVSS